jgi:uncharacterized membrane protein YfcA
VTSVESALIAMGVVATAAALQASIGFGLAIVAAPLLTLIDRAYVPGPLLMSGTCLALIMSVREWRAMDVAGVRNAVAGRMFGVIPAGYALQVVSARAYDLLFAMLVLAAVGLSLLRPDVRATPRSVFAAGIASGFMGTITSIGGPPLALVYQSARGPELRATLAGSFLLGSVLSLIALAVIGRFGAAELVHTAVLIPGIVLGVLVSRPLLHWLDRGITRPLVLSLSTASALAVLARALL